MFSALTTMYEEGWLTSEVGEFYTIGHYFRLTPLGIEQGQELLSDPAG
jgi:hypothetical protein